MTAATCVCDVRSLDRNLIGSICEWCKGVFVFTDEDEKVLSTELRCRERDAERAAAAEVRRQEQQPGPSHGPRDPSRARSMTPEQQAEAAHLEDLAAAGRGVLPVPVLTQMQIRATSALERRAAGHPLDDQDLRAIEVVEAAAEHDTRTTARSAAA